MWLAGTGRALLSSCADWTSQVPWALCLLGSRMGDNGDKGQLVEAGHSCGGFSGLVWFSRHSGLTQIAADMGVAT